MTASTSEHPTELADGSDFLLYFLHSRNAVVGAAMVLVVVLVAVSAPWLAPAEPDNVDLWKAWEGPSAAHWLGTDAVGRDVLSRLMHGARVSLFISVSVLAITLPLGTLLGMCAAWFGGWVDTLIMRTVDIIFGFPELVLVILIAAVLGPGKFTVIAALSLVWWPGVARLVRSLVLSLKSELYVDAAVTAGTPVHRIMRRHLLPNIVAPLIVRASIGVGFIIMAEATLSFLGIGVQEPDPTWGAMIRDGLGELYTDPHLALFSSLALAFTLIGFNLFGDGLRDVLDPRVRDR